MSPKKNVHKPPATRPLRALALDDDPGLRGLVGTVLRQRGHDVSEFGDAESALEAHRVNPFALMVVDWILPGMEGLELCRRVRAMPGGDAVAILVVTGRDRWRDIEEVLDAGATDYVAKPLDLNLLQTRLLIAERGIAEAARRLAAEDALKRNEANLTALIENTRDSIWSVDSAFNVITLNSTIKAFLRKQYGLHLEEGMNFLEGVPSDLRPLLRELLERTLRGEHFIHEHRIDTAQGHAVDVEFSFYPIRHANGSTSGATVFARDVTERKRAERALLQSQRDFRQLIENAPIGVLIHRGGRVVYANSDQAKLLGYRHGAELLGKTVEDLIHEDDRPAVFRQPERASNERSGVNEVRAVRRDGTYAIVEMMEEPEIEFEGKPARLLMLHDITDRKRLDAQLVLADRLASLGTLAAGVAHEINNPLGYVSTNLEFLAEQLGPIENSVETGVATEIDAAVREARQGVDRVRRIVKDLTQFARSQSESVGPVDVHTVIENALQMTSNELRHRARLVKKFGSVPLAKGNEGRLGQVFVNLLMNAAQAIPDGSADRNEITVRTSSQNGWVVVDVQDTGPGIALELQDRIFDPFFTTKPVGEGTGLGLSICHGIITGLGGDLRVESTVGSGTTMRVLLPAADRTAADERMFPRLQADNASHRARILVIDDEPLIGRSLRRALSVHEVIVADDGHQALEMMRLQSFDLVFCDLMMPDLSGMELFAKLREQNPKMADRVVFMTGGAFTAPAREFLDRVKNPRVEKPFDVGTLRTLVAERLRSPRTVAPPPR